VDHKLSKSFNIVTRNHANLSISLRDDIIAEHRDVIHQLSEDKTADMHASLSVRSPGGFRSLRIAGGS
jgi:hypothetical protein